MKNVIIVGLLALSVVGCSSLKKKCSDYGGSYFEAEGKKICLIVEE